MARLPLSALLLGLILSPAAPAAAQDAMKGEFARNLCQTALAGRLPGAEVDELRSAREAHLTPVAEVCACVAEGYAGEGDAGHTALRAEVKAAFSTRARFDELIAARIWSCLSPDSSEEDGSGLGEAVVTHVLACEGMLAESAPISGEGPADLLARIRAIGGNAETICGCSGGYFQHYHQQISDELEYQDYSTEAYESMMLGSINACIDLGGTWPGAEVMPDPALDPDAGPEAICYAVASRTIEIEEFDYAAQTDWEEGSGLTTRDMCECAGTMVVDNVIEEDIRAADDPGAYLLDATLSAAYQCRDAMWRP